jgi:hypothetical protein
VVVAAPAEQILISLLIEGEPVVQVVAPAVQVHRDMPEVWHNKDLDLGSPDTEMLVDVILAAQDFAPLVVEAVQEQ